ncbi:hypothetical protein Nepgr_016390 [Nepenthes gracilis]|uniref:Uncharacterized protein n=1 Tax=Nepenthes gracilis TaxID=150966 RepID=A0AAD3XS15_NEPGR|nr:hypothetical protein Nepgr_016390 [Nepenthes gracilis]
MSAIFLRNGFWGSNVVVCAVGKMHSNAWMVISCLGVQLCLPHEASESLRLHCFVVGAAGEAGGETDFLQFSAIATDD